MRKCVPSFVIVICVLVSAMGLQAATLFIDPVTQNIPPIGETLIVDVIVEGVADLGGYGFDMVFDATALKYTDMEEGEFLKEDGTTTMFIQKTDEASDGILKIAGLRFGSPPPTGVNGSGRLASVTFEVLTIKTSVIIFQNVKLHRPDLGLIDVDLVNGSIVVPMVYTIMATSGNHGNISPTGELIVTEGGSQVFSINPDICYHIADVAVDGASVGAVDTYTFPNVTSRHTITAAFAIDTYTITAAAGANGDITPSGIVTVNCGASMKYTITPENGYHVADVLVNSSSVGAVSTYTFPDIRADRTIQATFAVNIHTITATSGNHGNISPTGELIVTEGGSQVFAINPDICYHVADIVVDGVSVGVMDTYTFPNVTSGHTIAATFAIDTYTITATAGANGSITPSGIVTVDCGVSQKYAMTPEDGYHIVDVLVDAKSIGAVSEYIFEEVTSDHEITATFASSDGRSVEPTGKQLGEWGDIKRTTLYQNFPNPFNPDTWIPYQLSEAANVSITIYDITAKVIKNIDLGEKPAGRYRTKETAAHWDGRNEVGEPVVSGIYFAVLRARDCQQIRRMLLLK